MKVKTFVAGVANGVRDAFSMLDQDIADLGDIVVHSVVDSIYSEQQLGPKMDTRIVRVVVYSEARGQ